MLHAPSTTSKTRRLPLIWLAAILSILTPLPLRSGIAGESFDFQLRPRSRVETAPESGRFHAVTRPASWAPAKTAVIVCDMWDLHHCLNAVRRAEEMAPRMNRVLEVMRHRGATIIHAPSSCMDFYADHPARRRAQQVPRTSELPEEIGQWCYQIPAEEQGDYPIDQSDGGEDDDPEEHRQWAEKLAAMGRNPRAPWVRQMELLDIEDRDYISDDGAEIWSILEQKGIDQVVLLGVHTNMCVLGRPFGLRNMARYGKQVVLMRDMTDTMYNPEMSPFVSHFTGTDLIVGHIEKWVCPTITSDQILGGRPFRFSTDRRPHVVMIMAEPEYETEKSLPRYAAEHLGKEFQVSLVYADEEKNESLLGLEVLDEADVALISIRRRALPAGEMERIQRFVRAGKGVVGIRTANHAFSLRGQAPPEGKLVWEDWDQEVFGGNYTGHHGSGPETRMTMAPEASEHPIVQGIKLDELEGKGSLYIVNPLGPKATPLIIGEIPDKPAETIAWTNTTTWGGRAFYTSLGHKDDFTQPAFQQLLRNALRWGAETDEPVATTRYHEAPQNAPSPFDRQHEVDLLSPLVMEDGTECASPSDWYEKRRPELLRHWTNILGRLEPSARQKEEWIGDISRVELVDERQEEGYRRLHLRIPLEKDFLQDHLLLLPSGQGPGPFPAVIAWTSTSPDFTEPEKWWGAWLARRGFVVLTGWSFIRQDREGKDYRHPVQETVYDRYGRWLPLGKMAYDVRRQVEYLQTRDEVHPDRLGFIGFSLSGKTALYVAGLVPEVKATVALDPHVSLYGATNYQSPWYLDWEREFPDIQTKDYPIPERRGTVWSLLDADPARPGFERNHHELMALCAPRALMVIGCSMDQDSAVHSDDRQSWGYLNRAREVYHFLGIPERFSVASLTVGHRATSPEIDLAWQTFFLKWLVETPQE